MNATVSQSDNSMYAVHAKTADLPDINTDSFMHIQFKMAGHRFMELNDKYFTVTR